MTAVWDVTNVKTVAVIGGGVAGLQTVKQLTRSGFDVTLYESRARAGGVWATGTGYYGTGLQVPYDLYEFPDFPIATAGIKHDKYTSQAQLQAYVDAYITHFKIGNNLKFNTLVVSAVPDKDEKGWTLTTRPSGSEESKSATTTTHYDFLVIATGMYSSPNIPDIDGLKEFKGQIVHSSFVTNPDELYSKKNVLVVGFGKSSTDNAILAVEHGATSVTLVARQWHWPIPQKLLNVLDIKWGTLHRLTAAFIPLWVRPNKVEKALHQYAPFLVNGFWRLLSAVLNWQFKLAKTGTLPTTLIESDLFNNDVLFDDKFYTKIEKGQIRAILGEIVRFDATKVTLKDGSVHEPNVVVFGTGWKKEYPFLPAATVETLGLGSDGHFLYHHILHPEVQRLAFVGANVSTFSNITTHALQATWLESVLKGTTVLPPISGLQNELKTIREWKIKNFPNCASRGALLQLHMANYHDELSEEIGASRYRKSNPAAEVVIPYVSQDYAPVVSGTFRAEKPSILNRFFIGFLFVYFTLFWTKLSSFIF